MNGGDTKQAVLQIKTMFLVLDQYITDLKELLSNGGVLETDYIVAPSLTFRANEPIRISRVSSTTKADLEKAIELVKDDKLSSEDQPDDLVEQYKRTYGAGALTDLIKENL